MLMLPKSSLANLRDLFILGEHVVAKGMVESHNVHLVLMLTLGIKVCFMRRCSG